MSMWILYVAKALKLYVAKKYCSDDYRVFEPEIPLDFADTIEFIHARRHHLERIWEK
jgi:hypothetical protein